MHPQWTSWIGSELSKPYYLTLTATLLKRAQQGAVIFPPPQHQMAVYGPDPRKIRVVILGQDPYIRPGQAHGFSFSVPHGVPPPPSLKNIFKEIQSDIPGTTIDFNHGCLDHWTRQGVFLLNTVLTVEEGKSNSHKGMGWETFTQATIEAISQRLEHVVFLLWGKPAQKKADWIDTDKHLVLMAPHPSGLSAYRGFFGCQHFSQANAYLASHGRTPIDWANA